MMMVFLQEMSHSCMIIVLLSLQLSLLFWPTVSSLQCYKCNSIETPTCQNAGETSAWKTCEDDMCLTGIGYAQIPIFGISSLEEYVTQWCLIN